MALQTFTSMTPEALGNPLNPFFLFKRLKKQKADPLLNFTSHDHVFNGRTYAISSFHLRRLKGKLYTQSDLPANINFQTLKNYFTQLNKRLATLPNLKLAQTQQQCVQAYGMTLEQIEKNLCESPFVKEIFAERLPQEPILNCVFYFYTLLQYVSEQSPLIKEGEAFSPREERLLGMSVSILGCPTGQREGTELYYCNVLPPRYRKGNVQAELSAESKIREILASVVQLYLRELFMREDLLKSLMRKVSDQENLQINQASHHSEFLKNSFYRHLGAHALVFDYHTMVLNPLFLKLTPLEFFETFFQYFSVQELVKRFQWAIADELNASEGKLTNALVACLELTANDAKEDQQKAACLSPHPQTELITTKYFICDENCNLVGLTEEGITALLVQREVLLPSGED